MDFKFKVSKIYSYAPAKGRFIFEVIKVIQIRTTIIVKYRPIISKYVIKHSTPKYQFVDGSALWELSELFTGAPESIKVLFDCSDK